METKIVYEGNVTISFHNLIGLCRMAGVNPADYIVQDLPNKQYVVNNVRKKHIDYYFSYIENMLSQFFASNPKLFNSLRNGTADSDINAIAPCGGLYEIKKDFYAMQGALSNKHLGNTAASENSDNSDE